MEDRCLPSVTSLHPAPLTSSITAKTASSVVTDTVQGRETNWNQIKDGVYSTTFKGSASGGVPGTYNATVDYTGTPGFGVNQIVGGQWNGWETGQKGSQPTLVGSFTGGSITWNSFGTQAAVTAQLKVWLKSGAADFATFTGTVQPDHHGFTMSGQLRIDPHQVPTGPLGPPGTVTPQVMPASKGSARYSDTLHAQETTWHQVNDTVYSTTFSGSASGSLPGTFTTTLNYTGSPGSGTNPIVAGGQWQGTVKGQNGSQTTLSGSFSGGSIQWNKFGTSATVTANVVVSGGSKKVTGSGSFIGHITYAHSRFVLDGGLTLNLSGRV